jgi:hypothetical protein
MRREVRLADLTEREKENALLTLQGALKDLRSRIEKAAERSPTARRVLKDWSHRYEERLGFLERAYTREVASRQLERQAARNDRVWASMEARS